MPLFTGIKLNTENLETIEESDGSFTIKRHFGNYMNRSVLVNVKPSSAGTVIKYYQDVDNDTVKDSTDIEIGTATVTYAQADTPSHGSWEFSQLLNNPFGGESFQLDATGDYGPSGFLGRGKFIISTDKYSGNFDVVWTEVDEYKTIRVRNGSITPINTETVNYFQVPSLDIQIDVNSSTNTSEVRERTTTEEFNSIGNKIKLVKDITTYNDQNGIVTTGSYSVIKTNYDTEGVLISTESITGDIDPNATTTTNPNATTTTITGTTNPGDTTTTTNSTTSSTTEPTSTTIPSNLPTPYAYYSFDDTFNDVSPSGNNIHLTNTDVTFSSSGKKGKSASFNNSTSYLTALNFLTGNIENLTFTGWVARRTDGYIFNVRGGASNTGVQYTLYVPNIVGNPIGGYINNVYIKTPNDVLTQLEWKHVAAVWMLDGFNYKLKIYVNGILQIENTTYPTSAPYSNGAIYIGRHCTYTSGSQYYFDGYMDEIRIYDKALTEAEIAADMALSQ